MTPLVEAFPSGRFLIAHLGSPNNERIADKFLALAARSSNVWLDISYSHCYWKIADAYRVLGADKLVWGSDGPLIHPKVEIEKVRILNLPTEEEAKILGGNLLRLIGAD